MAIERVFQSSGGSVSDVVWGGLFTISTVQMYSKPTLYCLVLYLNTLDND
jgi:hypothetical protein